MNNTPQHLASFGRRVAASLIDCVIYIVLIFPPLIAIYGNDYWDFEKVGFIAGPADFLISWVFPFLVTIWLWMRYRGTPGKLLLKVSIVDAKTGDALTLKQCVLRYIGYYVSFAAFGIGCLWVAFDSRKQGWHDKMAGTVVIVNSSKV